MQSKTVQHKTPEDAFLATEKSKYIIEGDPGSFSLQALMLDAARTPNVVEACNKSGLYDTLEDTQKRYVSHTVYVHA